MQGLGSHLPILMSLSEPFNLASGGFLAASPLFQSVQLLCQVRRTQRRSCRLESCLQGMGDKKASVPRSPTGPCSHQNSAKCYLAVWMGGSVRRMGTCICMAESLCWSTRIYHNTVFGFFFFKKKINVAVPDLNCNMQDLVP